MVVILSHRNVPHSKCQGTWLWSHVRIAYWDRGFPQWPDTAFLYFSEYLVPAWSLHDWEANEDHWW